MLRWEEFGVRVAAGLRLFRICRTAVLQPLEIADLLWDGVLRTSKSEAAVLVSTAERLLLRSGIGFDIIFSFRTAPEKSTPAQIKALES
jgi:hypothetical protein